MSRSAGPAWPDSGRRRPWIPLRRRPRTRSGRRSEARASFGTGRGRVLAARWPCRSLAQRLRGPDYRAGPPASAVSYDREKDHTRIIASSLAGASRPPKAPPGRPRPRSVSAFETHLLAGLLVPRTRTPWSHAGGPASTSSWARASSPLWHSVPMSTLPGRSGWG